jgi:alkaline phosphatase
MTRRALDILEKNRKGFCLMIEGSQIDWANHAHSVQGQFCETLAFDETVEVVLDWVDERPLRRMQTLVIVVPDHETAGFAINGTYGTLSESGEIVDQRWTSGGHTAMDALIWALGPSSRKLSQALDNTDLYYVMENALK